MKLFNKKAEKNSFKFGEPLKKYTNYMKTFLKIFTLTVLTTGLLTRVDAQRSREFSGRSRDNSGGSRQMTSRSAPVRTFSRTPDRTYQASREVQRPNTRVYISNDRMVARNDNNRYRQTEIVRNNYNYRNNYSYNPYHGDRYYGNVYGHRTYFMYGPRYTVIPRSFISIRFGGYPYYYDHGCFYGFYDGYYAPIFPPFGLHISILPFGYTRIFIGAVPFYYYNGIYYRQYDNYYQVVDAPMGATVSSLPQGARSVIINGEKLYELNGTYYKADRDSNGNDVYVVVGKNGVINNTTDPQAGISNSPSSLQVGDVISQLPEGSKVVTLNGQQLYQTPDNTYLQEEDNNGTIEYKVVGK